MWWGRKWTVFLQSVIIVPTINQCSRNHRAACFKPFLRGSYLQSIPEITLSYQSIITATRVLFTSSLVSWATPQTCHSVELHLNYTYLMKVFGVALQSQWIWVMTQLIMVQSQTSMLPWDVSLDQTQFVLSVCFQSQSIGMNPLYVMVPCTLSASFAFMLPVATPPNAIVFSFGYLKVSDMVSLTVSSTTSPCAMKVVSSHFEGHKLTWQVKSTQKRSFSNR